MQIKIMTTVLLLATSLSMLSQTVEEKKAEMNRIKQAAEYYWEESTAENAEAAYSTALSKMLVSMASDKGGKVDSLEVVGKTNRIDIPRGTNMRVFVYCPKGNYAVQQSTVVNQPSVIEQSPVVEQQETAESPTTAFSETPRSVTSLISLSASDLLLELSKMKRAGTVASYGKCTREDLPLLGDAYLLMVSANPQRVTAILTPEQNGTRLNTATNTTDTISNYKGYFCMWVRTK